MSNNSQLESLATRWVAAWNARDLERIPSLYADDCEMASPNIKTLGLDATGRLTVKPALRGY